MSRDTRIVAVALAAVAALIAGSATVCAWAISIGASERWRLVFRVMCHGMPERSLVVFGEPMPICARCFGIYAGLLIGIVVFAMWPAIRESGAKIALWIAVWPIGIDGVTQALGLRTSTNDLRIATGLLVAIPFAVWALSAIEHRDRNAVIAS